MEARYCRIPVRVPARYLVGGVLAAVLLLGSNLDAQQVTGRVTDTQTGQPITAVQVFIEGSGIGALTQANGRYLLLNVPAGTHTLSAERIGYASANRQIDVAAGQTVVQDFTMFEAALGLDEIVVTGVAGGGRQREVGAAVSRIGGDQLISARADVATVLQGQTAGLKVLHSGGHPGQGAAIVLRGSNSVSMGNEPLVYVDGVRILSKVNTADDQRWGYSAMANIRPQDIERVEVVRGPAATTLYGTEASAGVIQIFTKRGITGAPQWSADITGGFATIGHVGPSVASGNVDGFGHNKCIDRENSEGIVWSDVTCPADGDWIKPALLQRYSFGVTGGIEGFTYAVSANFRDEGSPIDGSGIFTEGERTGYVTDGGIRANFTFQPTESLSLTWTTSLNGGTIRWSPDGTGEQGWSMHQTRGLGGSVKQDGLPAVGLLFLDDRNDKRRQNTTGLTIVHDLGERLTQRMVIGYDVNSKTHSFYEGVGGYNEPQGEFEESEWAHYTASLDYGATFRSSFRGGEITSVSSAGLQAAQDNDKYVRVVALQFPGPIAVPTLTSGATRRISRDNRLTVINAGFFFQQLIGYKEVFFFTAGLRVDGNSAFGESFGLQPYPKVSFSWILSDLDFWPEWSDSFKLRAAMGDAGQAPGAFDAIRSWSPIAADEGKPGFTPGAVGNADLGPERTREYEVGFDGSFLGGRITSEFSYFRQRTTDALLGISPIPSLGFSSSQLTNVGVLENNGFEVAVNAQVISNDLFTWGVGATFAQSRTNAIDLNGLGFNVDDALFVREGYPVPSWFAWDIVNADEKADPIIEKGAFRGRMWPDRNMGLNTNIAIGGLRLSAAGDFQWGGNTDNRTTRYTTARLAFGPCYPAQRAQRKMLAGDGSDWANITAYERSKCTIVPSEQNQANWIESNDFFQLRAITASYNLPEGLIPGTTRAALNLAATGDLWNSTDYWGTHPESRNDARGSTNTTAVQDYNDMPPFQTITMSLSVGF